MHTNKYFPLLEPDVDQINQRFLAGVHFQVTYVHRALFLGFCSRTVLAWAVCLPDHQNRLFDNSGTSAKRCYWVLPTLHAFS